MIDGREGRSRWELEVSLQDGASESLFIRLSRTIQEDIRKGRLRAGDRLPSTRKLALELGLHRNTVLAGYDDLLAQGWVTTRRGGGTLVSETLRGAPSLSKTSDRLSWAQAGFDLPDQPVAQADVPVFPRGTLVLIRGAPDVRLLPVSILARAYRRAMTRHGRSVLMLGPSQGHPQLREALSAMLAATRGITAPASAILVTRGSTMGIALGAKALLAPGDGVAVEALGYRGCWEAMQLSGARLFPVPIDGDGIQMEALKKLVQRHRIRAVYVTPHHQFPTTRVMSAGRRLQLLELAREQRLVIFEDDYDHEFHYDGRQVLPLASQDRAGVVLYLATLSKTLAPGLRLGFAVAPQPLIERMTGLRRILDVQGDLAMEYALAELFEDGVLQRHMRRMRRTYRLRRNAFVEALQEHLGSALTFEIPQGGMALWAKVSNDIDIDAWAAQALEHGVAFRGARPYSFAGEKLPFVRLGFSPWTEAELREAARRMARALKGLPARLRRRPATG